MIEKEIKCKVFKYLLSFYFFLSRSLKYLSITLKDRILINLIIKQKKKKLIFYQIGLNFQTQLI